MWSICALLYIYIYITYTHQQTYQHAHTHACPHTHTTNDKIDEYIPRTFKCILLGTFLHIFALMPLANLHHYVNHALIFVLTSFGLLYCIMLNPYFWWQYHFVFTLFFIYTHLFKNTTTGIKMDWVWFISHSAIFWPRKVFAMTCGVTHILGIFLSEPWIWLT
jgi:hypothetical protein